MTSSAQSQELRLYRFDPVANLLIGKYKLSPLGFGILAIVCGTGLYLFTAWLSNTLWSKPGQMGLLQDWFPWVWVLFINPVVSGYYLWSFQALDQVIQDLKESGVLDTNESKNGEIEKMLPMPVNIR
ncbi:MAG: hypothetical protein HC772_12550 [Leptolyngbyaceae cyanobacterium CRU_2_3]|nr:hypothetical protein [Leptolyngbyaceae cyanobacterium CRU_2_3]